MDFVAIDFETANRFPTSACSLGLIVFRNGEIFSEKYWLIRPQPNFFEFTYIHGLGPSDVILAPEFPEAWSEIRPLLEDEIVFAHNASFDIGVLKKCLDFHDLAYPQFKYACSLSLARRSWKNEYNRFGLKNMATELNIPLQHHDALSDARACGLIVQAALNKYSAPSLKELYRTLGMNNPIKSFRLNNLPFTN